MITNNLPIQDNVLLAVVGLFFISQGFRLFENRKAARWNLAKALLVWDFAIFWLLPLIFAVVGMVRHG